MSARQQLQPHRKDLGGGFLVRRLLPAAQRQAVGPFLFFDHMRPVTATPADNHDVRHNLYDYSIQQIDSALKKTGQKLDCILWHQGESDGPLSEPEVFRRQFDRLIEGLRERYGPVPFILGQLSPEYMNFGPPKLAGIDAVHQDTPNRWDHARFVPSPPGMLNGAPGSGLPEDPHFTAEAGRIIGRRMFEAYQDFVRSS